jgi:hypothetical protein
MVLRCDNNLGSLQQFNDQERQRDHSFYNFSVQGTVRGENVVKCVF